jgi:hypothetical protein
MDPGTDNQGHSEGCANEDSKNSKIQNSYYQDLNRSTRITDAHM